MKIPPLVILGLDGADPELIQSFANEGYLPTIASLMKDGCWAKTTGTEHLSEHGTALSLLSGISRKQHGYYYFRQLQSGTYDLRAFTHSDAKTSPFWSHLQGRSKKVAIIDAPDSNLVPNLPGIQLANWSVHEAATLPLRACALPSELLQDARRIYGCQIPVLEFKPGSTLEEDLKMYLLLLQRIENKGKLCRELLSRDSYDLIVAGFFESHTAGHRFWKYRSEASLLESKLTHAIRDIYQAIDRQIGLLLTSLPKDANIFVISCFGIKDQYPTTGLIEAFCHQLGYQVAEATTPGLNPLNLARQIVPTLWRQTLSNHLPLRVQERLLADQFRNGTNWQKTTAFAIPSLYTSFMRVNLLGREPQGIVQPGDSYHALLSKLEDDLKQLIDPVTGKPAVERVVRTADWFNWDVPESLPDLFIEWQTARHYMERVIHPKTELIQQKHGYHRDSYHSLQGFMAAKGPSISSQGEIADVELLNLAPTFLTLMGEPPTEGMSGKVVEAMIKH